MATKADTEFGYETSDQFRVINGVSFALFAILVGIGVAISYLTEQSLWQWILLVVGLLVLFSIKVVRQWEKAIVLRFGRFHRVMQPGPFLAIPLVGGGDHDWNELFYRFGLLTEPAVERISTGTHVLGTAIMIAGLAWAAYFALPAGARERVHDELTSRLPWLESILES